MGVPAHLRIEVSTTGDAEVLIGQPPDEDEAAQIWGLYRALRPQIRELEKAARREAQRLDKKKYKPIN